MTNDSETPIIIAQNVQKTYDTGRVQVHALRGVDLSVPRGEMVAIMGPSGCGKTTLLNCLSGLDEVDGGAISIGGMDLATMSDNQKTEFRAREMGYVFQSYNLLPVLTARENVEMPLLVSGVRARDAHRRALEVLDMVALADWEQHYPAELSGGQQQRVAIARALVNQPQIIWADEPTGNLDSESSKDVMDLLCQMNRENDQTFVLVTHAESVASRAHRTVQMRDGHIVSEHNNHS